MEIELNNNVIDYYNTYDEDGRLFRNYSHQIEWLTTIHYFDNLIPNNSKIFDGCAGTGNYAFKLAQQGHSVVASDIVPRNVNIITEKQKKNPILKEVFVGDICNCNHYDNHYFDVVLCMGAFYHLNESMRCKAMEQCLRLLNANGMLVISYINLLAVLHLNIAPQLANISEILKCYHAKSFGDCFVYMMPEEIEKMADKYNLKILHHITVDENPLLRCENFCEAKKEDFEKYMKLHFSICENKNFLGCGLHNLVFLQQ